MTPGRTALNYRPIHLRHLVDAPSTAPGAVQVLGRWFAPQDRRGINGRAGWVSAEVEDRLLEEGRGKIRLPNTVGGDGVAHVDRFRCLGSTADAYAPGDEWIELYEGPFPHGDLLACVTPGDMSIDGPAGIELVCTDALGPLKAVRETTAGHWHHAPRDAIEHYAGLWQVLVGEGFDGTGLPATWTSAGTVSQPLGTGELRLTNSATNSHIRAPDSVAVPLGMDGTTPPPATTFEFEVRVDRAAGGQESHVQLYNVGGAGGFAALELYFFDDIVRVAWANGNTPTSGRIIYNFPGRRLPGNFHVRFELRGKWIFTYLDGALLGVLPMTPARTNVVPRIYAFGSASLFMDWRSVLVRQHRPFLMRGADKGDLRLPGARTSGGLVGEYYDDADASQQVLSPVREPYARRLDAALAFGTGFQPTGPARAFSARWTGAIYFALAEADRVLQIGANGTVRIWVGWTTGEPHFTAVSSEIAGRSLREHLGGALSGWYPVVIEFVSPPSGGGGFTLRDGPPGGPYQTYPTAGLSPLGIYTDHVRHESHHDQIAKIASTSGYQWRCAPRQLESGRFPGEVVPRIRVGRDTAYVIDENNATDVAVKLAAREVAHTLIVDAAGTSDPTSGNQLTREAIDYDAITKHLIVHQAMENLADITDPALLEQRANSLLALFASPWEEASARDPINGLKDAWPVVNGPRFIAAYFTQTSSTLRIATSADGLTWSPPGPVNYPGPYEVRDPSITRWRDRWYVAHTDGAYSTVAVSDDLINWTLLRFLNVVAMPNPPDGTAYNWAPEWFLDADGPHLIISGTSAGLSNFDLYETHPLDGSNLGGAWSPAVKLTAAAASGLPHNVIDASIVKTGATYNLFYKNETTKFIELATATALTGPYTRIVADNAFGFGADVEAPQIVALPDGRWRLYMDRYMEGGKSYFSESATLNGGWSPRALVPFTDAVRHPGYILTDAQQVLPSAGVAVGDGIRLDLPTVGVRDLSPRQILGVTRTLVPNGAGVPVVAFRQRPRSFSATVRGILKTALQPRRTYQGTESWKTGSYAHRGATGGVDAVSRVPLPSSQARVLGGVLVVTAKSDTSAHTIVVNGVATGLTAASVGRYPVDAHVAPLAGAPVVTAQTTGGTGTVEYVLELLVRI